MPYVKQDFGDGNVLYAEQLNHMEQGIYDAMEKAEQGGGGSDYTLDEIVDAVLAALPNGDAEGVTLIDRANGKSYTVYVSDGKLMMEESEG